MDFDYFQSIIEICGHNYNIHYDFYKNMRRSLLGMKNTNTYLKIIKSIHSE